MKKIGKVIITSATALALFGCGNYKMFDTTYTYNYAQLRLPSGDVVEGRVTKWTDYEGEQIQVTLEDGNTYLVSSYNAILTVKDIRKQQQEDGYNE